MLPREKYILNAITSIFKGGEWVEAPIGSVSKTPPVDIRGTLEGPENGSEGLTGLSVDEIAERLSLSVRERAEQLAKTLPQYSEQYLTVIGGTKYDEDQFLDYMATVKLNTFIVTGKGRGCEQIASTWHDQDRILVIEINEDLYGKDARKVNVEQVLSFAPHSPLLLVGKGTRVQQAKAWLKRCNWQREVIELP